MALRTGSKPSPNMNEFGDLDIEPCENVVSASPAEGSSDNVDLGDSVVQLQEDVK